MAAQQLRHLQRRLSPVLALALRLVCRCGPAATLLAASALVLSLALPCRAGMVVNRDKKTYVIVAHWDDLSTPEKQEIHPGEKLFFEDKPCTVEVIGQRDNMYLRPRETIILSNGVLRRVTGE